MVFDKIMTALKGFLIGGTMLVPGVSGGSMAMILGIYQRLVSAVSSFFRHKRESFIFLSLFAIGGGAGMLLLSKPILHLLHTYPMPMLYFFMGAVAGGVPLILRQAKIKKFTWRVPLYTALGILIVLLINLLPTGSAQAEMETSIVSVLLLGLAGFIAAAALVLPGISVSYLLLLMGLYDEMMKAISNFYLPFLVPLGVGLILGIILTTKLLDKAMSAHPQPTYLIILGFIIASVAEIYPGLPAGAAELLICFFMLCGGYVLISLLSRNN